jgi:hypothetical protein
MATEALTLPVFETARGELVGDVDSSVSLRYGFLLQEKQRPQFGPLHQAHACVARDLLADHGEIDTDSTTHLAIPGLPIRSSTPRHFDGLSNRYFQVVTNHVARDAGGSMLRLLVYPPDVASHSYFRSIAETLDPSDTFEETVFADGDDSGAYPYAFAGMLPDIATSTYDNQVLPGTTAVFSNGYPALANSNPSEIVLHEAAGIASPCAPRVLSLSTIR